ncbi:MAG: hypothetical protein QOJ99_1409 [Bryobacterales bacterium]|jgi:hypothetical protein|nr:hypothetical protein [Bryobacterales bacterium]
MRRPPELPRPRSNASVSAEALLTFHFADLLKKLNVPLALAVSMSFAPSLFKSDIAIEEPTPEPL